MSVMMLRRPRRRRPGPAERDISVERTTVERHLRARRALYYPCASDPRVEFVKFKQRTGARLYWFRVHCEASSHDLVVKVHSDSEDVASVDTSRPRLVVPLKLTARHARERAALELLEQHLGALDDSRFGAIPILDRIDSLGAVVMAQVDGISMNTLLARLSRLHPTRSTALLRQAVANAGAWLRTYHGLKVDGSITRQPDRDEFIAFVQRYCNHLAASLGRPEFFRELAKRMTAAAWQLYSTTFSLGLSHGDFAMRNILVASTGRVFVFDTRAFSYAPIYEDLATFALAIRVSRAQTYSHGLFLGEEHLQALEQWLFRGYFGHESVPLKQIQLYALLLLLDKWSVELVRPTHHPRLVRAARMLVLNRWFERQTRLLLARLD
jgi:aminoglycoside phosphotransferase (APT) family kinase protein